jgi:hypothetical protein
MEVREYIEHGNIFLPKKKEERIRADHGGFGGKSFLPIMACCIISIQQDNQVDDARQYG